MKQSGIDAWADTVPGDETPVGETINEEMESSIRPGKYRKLKYYSPVLSVFLGLTVCLLFLVLFINSPAEDKRNIETRSVKQSKSKSSRPHVIFILADDYGFNDIGYHGSKIRTPVMDSLANDGVILENYYVQPKCSPTRSQLLSGRYQIHTGLQHGTIKAGVPNCLPLDEETLPQSLKKLGYATHMIGKWHLGFYRKACLPTKRGFDSFFGLLLGSGGHWSHESQGGYDFRVNENVARQYKNKYSTTLFAKQARKIIMSHKADEPLFLYIPFQAVHTPLEVPARYSLPYRDVFPDRNRQIYAGMVTCMDEAVGNITNALKEKGIYDNTVIIFSTDNGAQVHSSGGSNWPLRGMKGTLWEGGIRGVGFVHSNLIPKSVRGTVNRQLYHVSDWFPTIVEGIAKSKHKGSKPLDGYNVWESIRQNKPSPRKEILHNIDSLRLPLTPKDRWGKESIKKIFDVGQRSAIRQGDWKLLTGTSNRYGWYAPSGSEHKSIIRERSSRKVLWLFNITADPYEKTDLSDIHTDVVMKLLRKLAKYNATAVHPKYPSPDPAADPSKHGGVWGPWARRPPKGFKGIYGPVCSKGHSASCVKSLKHINDDINNYDVIIKKIVEEEMAKQSQSLQLKIRTDVKKQLKPNLKLQTKIKNQSDVKLQTKLKLQPQVNLQPLVKIQPDINRNPDVKLKPKVKLQPKIKKQLAAKLQSKVKRQPKVKIKPKNKKVNLKHEVNLQHESKLQLTLKDQPKVRNQSNAKLPSEVKHQPEDQIQSEEKHQSKVKLHLKITNQQKVKNKPEEKLQPEEKIQAKEKLQSGGKLQAEEKPQSNDNLQTKIKNQQKVNKKLEEKLKPDEKHQSKENSHTKIKNQQKAINKPEEKLQAEEKHKAKEKLEAKVKFQPKVQHQHKPKNPHKLTNQQKVQPKVKLQLEEKLQPEENVQTKETLQPKEKLQNKEKIEPKVKLQTKTKNQSKVKTQPKAKNQQKLKLQPKVKLHPKEKNQPKVKSQPEVKFQPKEKIQTKTKPKPKNKPKLKIDSKNQPKVINQHKIKDQPKVKLQPDVKLEPEVKLQPEVKPKVQNKLKIKSQSKIKNKPKEKPKPEVNLQPEDKKLRKNVKSLPKVKIQPKVKLPPKGKLQPEAKHDLEVKLQPEKVKLKPEEKLKPKVKQSPKIKSSKIQIAPKNKPKKDNSKVDENARKKKPNK